MKIEAKEILKMGNPVLRQISEAVANPVFNEIRDLVEVMRLSMIAAGGVGLAAPQIGVLKRVVILEVPAARIAAENGAPEDIEGVPQTILVNPVITPLSDEMVLGWEGCLSVPGLRGLVPRYQKIRYEAVAFEVNTHNSSVDLEVNAKDQTVDLQVNRITREVDGFHARVVQHEVDHLDGVLYPERMTDIRQLIYQSEMPSFMESYNSAQKEKT